MEMAFFEQLPNHKLLKLWILTLWFKDSGGTTTKTACGLRLFYPVDFLWLGVNFAKEIQCLVVQRLWREHKKPPVAL